MLIYLRDIVELALILHAGHIEQGLQTFELGVQGQLVVLLHHASVAVLSARKPWETPRRSKTILGTDSRDSLEVHFLLILCKRLQHVLYNR